jgi:release factor glutamine methyltransferase
MSFSKDSPSIGHSLLQMQAQGLDRLDAQLLTLHVLGRSSHDRAWLIAHDTDTLSAQQLTALHALVQRRLSGEPMAYITGFKAFFGLNFKVDARVLVPRPDTETLVTWALETLDTLSDNATRDGHALPLRVIDLGTGSGAIALALKNTRPEVNVTAVDASAEALAVARDNAQRHGLVVDFLHGSWFERVSGLFNLVVSNPPYIAEQDTHLDALSHEPIQALTSGKSGLDDIRQLVLQAPRHLQPSGWLLLEHGYDQAAAVRELLEQSGFEHVQSRQDLSGIERCSGGQFKIGF